MNNNENETLILESTRRALEESKGKVPETTVKPFVVQNENVIVKKKYLVLKYYSADDDGEEVKDFDFFEGTTQELYEYLKDEIINNDHFDVMKSKVLVDSPRVSLSKMCSVYGLMENFIMNSRVIDETSFNIRDYYYDIGGTENGETEK